MIKELKFTESGWFETRDGERAFACHCSGGMFPLIGSVGKTIQWERWKVDGKSHIQDERPTDLVRHLPGCDSWDWIEPPQWRPFANAKEVILYADPWIRWKSHKNRTVEKNELARIVLINDEQVFLSHHGTRFTYAEAFEFLEFENGNPFGVGDVARDTLVAASLIDRVGRDPVHAPPIRATPSDITATARPPAGPAAGATARFGDQVMKWIKVSEELPDSDITVLIALSDGEVWLGYYDSEDDRWMSAEGCGLKNGSVTHWMDLPEVPAESI